MADGLIRHTGGCHCGAVRFEVWAPPEVSIYDCDCTICTKKQIKVFVVPHANFNLLQGDEYITTYTYNTRTAKHWFCKVCGVQSFYQPRSVPEGTGIDVCCVDPGSMKKVNFIKFDGVNFFETFKAMPVKWN